MEVTTPGALTALESPAGPARGERRRLSLYRRPYNGPFRSKLRLRLAQLCFLLFVLGAWTLYARMGFGEEILVKSPSEVWDAFVELVRSGSLKRDLLATLKATIVALLLGSAVGVAIGVGLGLLPRIEAVVAPYLDAVNAMPRIALAPVFIVYFGIGMAAKVALAFTLVVFIALVSARAGVRSTDADILQLSTVLGSSKPQTFVKVLLPVAVPSIFGGIRLGLIYALLGVVGSELIASRDGLGQQVARSTSSFQLASVYAVLLLLAVVAAFLNTGTAWLERRLLRWQPPKQR